MINSIETILFWFVLISLGIIIVVSIIQFIALFIWALKFEKEKKK